MSQTTNEAKRSVWSSLQNSMVTQRVRTYSKPKVQSEAKSHLHFNPQSKQSKNNGNRRKKSHPQSTPKSILIKERKKNSTSQKTHASNYNSYRTRPNSVKTSEKSILSRNVQTIVKTQDRNIVWPALQETSSNMNSDKMPPNSSLRAAYNSSSSNQTSFHSTMSPSAPIFVSSSATFVKPQPSALSSSKSALPATSGWATTVSHFKQDPPKSIYSNSASFMKPAPTNLTSTTQLSIAKPDTAYKPTKSNIPASNTSSQSSHKQAPTPKFKDSLTRPGPSKKTLKKSKESYSNQTITNSLNPPSSSISKKKTTTSKPSSNPSNKQTNPLFMFQKTVPPPTLDPRMENFFAGKAMINSKNHTHSSNTKCNDKNTLHPMANAIVKGKQRVKPRKKKLSTLKKKVLQERLRQWKELNAKKKNPNENSIQSAATSTDKNSTGTEDNTKTISPIPNLSISSPIISLYNFVSPEELEDDDEYDEIHSDLLELSTKIGPVASLHLPRMQNIASNTSSPDSHKINNVGLAFVTFETLEDANAALGCWSKMLLSGNRVETFMVDSYDMDWKKIHDYFENHETKTDPTTISNETKDSSSSNHIVILENIITDDDLEDDECFEECKEDIHTYASQYGDIEEFLIKTEGLEKGLVFITYQESSSNNRNNFQVSNNAMQNLNGIQIGGQIVKARLYQHSENSENSEKMPILIKLDNVLTEDDYTDEECFEETKEDIMSLLEDYGKVQSMSIERSGPNQGVITFCLEGGLEIASNAVHHLNGMILGGQSISAVILDDSITELSQNQSNATNHLLEKKQESSTIVLNNLLNEDDFDDEDCLEETKNDVESMVSKYGTIETLQVETSGIHKGLVFITYKKDQNLILANIVNEMDGMTVGGVTISAKIKAPTSTQNHDHGEKTTTRKVLTMEEEKSLDKPNSLNQISLMYSGNKIIPQRYAECKLVPKIPNSGIPREYASRIPDDSAVRLLIEMLGELMKFQLRSKDDANARARRRLVLGLREVARGIRSHKVKMVIMANNLDTYGAIDAKLEEILNLAKEEDVPVLFEFNKRKLGKALGKSIKVSVVGVQSADGAHEQFKKLKKLSLLPRVPSS